jgi:raffinose/stachyose/melibiose transport system substrate-binding protein
MSSRHLRTAAALAAVGLVTIAGCSTDTDGGSEGSGDGITVVGSAGDPEHAVVDLFLEANADAQVQVETNPGNSYAQVVATQLAGGTAGDIIRSWPGNGSNLSVVQAAENGFFAPLDDLDFVSQLSEDQVGVLSSADGQIMGVPVTTAAVGGVYNVTKLDELGLTIPTTFSEVLAFCSDARAAGVTPFGFGAKDAWTTQFVPYALGATLLPTDIADVEAASDAPFSGTAWADVFAKFDEMRSADCFTDQPNGTSLANVISEIAAGESLATVSLTDTLVDVLEEAPAGTEVQFAPLPATDDPSQTRLSTGIGAVYSLNADAANPELATQVLEFFATPEAQAAYSVASDQSPAMAVPDDFEADQPTQVILDYTEAQQTSSWPDQQWPNPNVQQVHFTQIQSLFAGDAGVADVLAALDAAYLAG